MPTTNNVGLFAQTTGGSITDVRLTDVVGITGRTYVGALVGYNAASIERCSVTGAGGITATGQSIGGLIGYSTGAISNSYSTLNVGSANGYYVGGLVGRCSSNGISVDKCYTTGTVAGRDYVGGISGRYGVINNCVALGARISGNRYIGRIVGRNGTLIDCYAISNMTLNYTQNGIYDGTDVTPGDTKTADFWENTAKWTDVWKIEDLSYPTLKNIP